MLSNLLSNKNVFVIMKSKMSLGVRGERGGKLSTKLREGIYVGGGVQVGGDCSKYHYPGQ